jgi:putative methionine-R-sulfoxide reductase with GAF domain
MNEKDFNKVISQLDQFSNIQSATQFLIKTICALNGWPYGEIWLPSKDEAFMSWVGSWSNKQEYFAKFSEFSAVHGFAKGVGLIGRTWNEKKPLWIENISTDNNFLRTEVALQSQVKSAISIPILHEDKVLCILCFFKNNLINEDKEKTHEIFNHSQEIGKILSEIINR